MYTQPLNPSDSTQTPVDPSLVVETWFRLEFWEFWKGELEGGEGGESRGDGHRFEVRKFSESKKWGG